MEHKMQIVLFAHTTFCNIFIHFTVHKSKFTLPMQKLHVLCDYAVHTSVVILCNERWNLGLLHLHCVTQCRHARITR